MSVVAVAGGLGGLGRLIVDALIDTGKHEVYVLSRKAVSNNTDRLSPLTGQRYCPIIQTDYSEESLTVHLTERNVSVVICAFIMDCDSVSDAQLRLIRAADRSDCVRRFVPSEFNVEYDVGDDVLPYPDKRFHLIARKALGETTTLEYAYFYPGMFMDYFGMPRVTSSLRLLYFFVDPINGQAILPDDGEGRMSMTFTTDAARYLALAIELEKWPRILTAVASTVSLNELVKLIEQSLGRPLEVRYQPVAHLIRHETIDLPSNLDVAKQYPERFPDLEQLRVLIADLEAGVALGAYDLSNGDRLQSEHLDLVELFEGKTAPPRRIEDLVKEAWGKG